MTQSLPQEQDSVAKFSLEAGDYGGLHTLLSQSSDLILHPEQELRFSSQLTTGILFNTNLARQDLSETNGSSGGPLQMAELSSSQNQSADVQILRRQS